MAKKLCAKTDITKAPLAQNESYSEKQAELDRAIKRAKDEHKSKVEEMLKTNTLKDVWTGLRALPGQSSTMSSSSPTSVEGSADRLPDSTTKSLAADMTPKRKNFSDGLKLKIKLQFQR